MFPPGNAPVAEAVRAHLEHRQAWYAPMIGPLVVPDTALRQVLRAEPVEVRGEALRQAQGTLDVSVINTGGAGGLLGLARRDDARRTRGRGGVRAAGPRRPGRQRRPGGVGGRRAGRGRRRLRGDPVRAGLGTGGGGGRGGRAAGQDPYRQPGQLRHPGVHASWPSSCACWSRPTCRSRPRPACTTRSRRRADPRPARPARLPQPAGRGRGAGRGGRRCRGGRLARATTDPARGRRLERRDGGPGPPPVPQLRLLRGARPGPRPGRPRAGRRSRHERVHRRAAVRGLSPGPGRRPGSAWRIGERVLDVGAALAARRGGPGRLRAAQPQRLSGPRARGLGGDPGRPCNGC